MTFLTATPSLTHPGLLGPLAAFGARDASVTNPSAMRCSHASELAASSASLLVLAECMHGEGSVTVGSAQLKYSTVYWVN